jgi:hypothetical protein
MVCMSPHSMLPWSVIRCAPIILGAQRLGLFTVWLPRQKQRKRVQEYLASGQHRRSPSSAKTNFQQPFRAEVAAKSGFYDEDYLPANVQGRDGYLERFLCGEIRPDLIIEAVAELRDIFRSADSPANSCVARPQDLLRA